MTVGPFIQELREALDMSQGELAARLCEVSQRPTVTREQVSRWERGVRNLGPFWARFMAQALEIPEDLLHPGRVKRRTFLTSMTVASLGGTAFGRKASEIMSSVAGADSGPLAGVQTSHQTDLVLAGLVRADKAALRRLAAWTSDGESAVLRVNAAGILAKLPDNPVDMVVIRSLANDLEVRERYLSAVKARVGMTVPALVSEAANPHDAGARWCAAYLLGTLG
ncbi:helix-turn-helix transcriptional regulator [Actinocorallia sp. A-T 12471]|uniref:helix-turn-helix domain-containing protein n=1 Tax=Actinocorallia sp. A-T 12471 TaxID=3089813 RepID=UPI0029CBF319|nr:helix-turn-helix transcriptional regulator [Actinocorallia sp. A-T 12471]MDX6738948.1 helix-turn-helix transcriptional regulator [Actinocorallia sp. A-T 12471]